MFLIRLRNPVKIGDEKQLDDVEEDIINKNIAVNNRIVQNASDEQINDITTNPIHHEQQQQQQPTNSMRPSLRSNGPIVNSNWCV